MKWSGRITSGASVKLMIAAGLMIGLLPITTAQAQEPGGRFKVLVVPLESSVLDKKFGEKVAEKLSGRIDDLATHTAIDKRDFNRALKQYEVKREDLNAIRSRQLAKLMGAQVVYYGTVAKNGTAYEVNSSFITVQTGDEVPVPNVPVADKGNASQERVADAAMVAFEEQVKFERARTFCADYVSSQQPDNALRNCNEALTINPESVPTLFNKGLAFRYKFENDTENTEMWADSAAHYFEKVIAIRPSREAYEQLAYIESRRGNAEKASAYYRQFLELDPSNVPVRVTVAYNLGQAGLMPEAIAILEDGLEHTPDDPDLLQAIGDYCLSAAEEELCELDKAINSYSRVIEIKGQKGEEVDQQIIENALGALIAADRGAEAVEFADGALRSYGDNARLNSLYADALSRVGRYGDAAQAMSRALAIDPAYPNGYLKRAQFKMRGGDDAGANADIQEALSSGTSTQEDVFNLFWAEALTDRKDGKYGEAVRSFEKAAQYVDPSQKAEVEFWWAYSCYQRGEGIAQNESASLNQLRSAESAFKCAQTHFARAGNVRPEVAQFKDATSKWLLNIEARIKRASRG